MTTALCRAAGCPRPPQDGHRTCYPHRGLGLERKCAATGCRARVRNKATHCREHYRTQTTRRPAPVCASAGCGAVVCRSGSRCRAHAAAVRRKSPEQKHARPAKTPRATLERQKLWRVTHPKGPPCVVCGDRLMQKPKHERPPRCMTCRVSEARGKSLTSGAKPPPYLGERDENGCFLPRLTRH